MFCTIPKGYKLLYMTPLILSFLIEKAKFIFFCLCYICHKKIKPRQLTAIKVEILKFYVNFSIYVFFLVHPNLY